jgi:hypothetical protein
LDLAPWEVEPPERIMLPMTRAAAISHSRFLLLPDTSAKPRDRGVKRYRLARLKLEGRDAADRFAHLKRVYD